MKKVVILVFLSLFVSMVNAAGMPIELSKANSVAVESSSHDHCHEVASIAYQDDDGSQSRLSASHYCCSSAAVLTGSLVFEVVKQSGIFLSDGVAIAISNIAESIYKPPKNYL
ncbi:hypothetical protein [Polynucleobacter sinensis]|jgi:hypothetical protein|uniref:hypothetical protein n=1 Tax=Polynucleobacter sinensis TaxID=1743157 RepID=UPI000782CEE6|nr:hypothetical protein [Polynucleobacter sinensis]